MKQYKTTWFWQKFSELTTERLYEILHHREAVFQLEQQSLYQDIDMQDLMSWHCYGLINNDFCGYLRVNPKQDQIIIGRVLTPKQYRGEGIGRALLQEAITFVREHYHGLPIVISAQIGLAKYYESLGFNIEGSPYDDGGIMHIDMRLNTLN